jgi:TonB-dependent receptor
MASSARTPIMHSDARLGALLRSGASLLAVCAFAAATPAFAQNAPAGGTAPKRGTGTAGNVQQSDQNPAPENRVSDSTTAPDSGDESTIVVTGLRQSLANSQNIKRNSDTVVDAITASDIGALPDRSVTEALQRVPGVAMNRFAGSNDPDHFSVEGSGVVVRGLNFVRSEFNGRDTFSAGVYGQAINFSDVPSELLGSVEVYKNTTAEMIEGGLAGTVNLNTRLPFDNKGGFHLGMDLEANQGDMRKKTTPVASILVSDTWDTGIGRIGLLADFSYSRLKSRSDGLQVTNFQTRDNANAIQSNTASTIICRNPLPSSTDTTRLPPGGSACGTASTAGADGLADLRALSYAPLGGQFRTQDYDRTRKGIALAAQWESVDRRAHLTAQFLRTDSRNRWGEHTFESAPDLSEYNTYPAGCHQNGNNPNGGPRAECRINGAGEFFFAGNDRGNGYGAGATSFPNYIYDSNNVFESGFITLPGTGWRTATSGSSTTNVPTGGMQQSLSRRQVDDRNVVNDYGLNFKFEPNSHWAINLDGDYTQARHDTLDVSVFGSTFADEELDLRGKLPVITPHKPLTLSATWAAPNPRIAGENDSSYFQDPNVQFWRAAMDHIEHSTGHEWAFKGDVAYTFDDGSFLKRLKFGARYADRQEIVRYTTYNWGAISEVWSGTAVSVAQGGLDRVNYFSFNNFFRNQTPGPNGGFYYNGDLINGYADAATYFKHLNDIWRTTNGAGASNRWVPLSERAGVVAGTDFLPTEIQPVSQKDKDAYAMLSFGHNEPIFGNVRLDGNIGVRYVGTDVASTGAFQFPTQQQLGVADPFTTPTGTGRCDPKPPPAGSPPGTPPSVPGGICALGPVTYAQLRQFATGASVTDVARNHYHYFLPSLNLKFGLTRDLLFRLAGSRVLARPAMADIRNFVNVGIDLNTQRLVATAGNPFLKPALAWEFDATLEWYFARVGSLTFDAFYKDVENFFYQSVVSRPAIQGGVTENIDVRAPANFTGHGKIKGVEVAYQQTFDFLPGLFSGLGVNATYSFIKSRGLPNSYLGVTNTSPIGRSGNLPLEQLSKHNVNFTVFYEKGPVSLRAAYNWRSRFLLTAQDVIFPYYPIYNEATGQLDASAFFSVTKNIKVGVQGVNLTNEVTKTSQQFSLTGLRGPRSYFMNDRRYSLIVRANF